MKNMIEKSDEHSRVHSLATLRSINFRVTSTPTKQLPHFVAQIAALLWNARSILSASPDELKSNAEASTLVHRFKTSLSTLLQDRTIEGRWSAVVLAKAAIEAGGIEIIAKSGPWVKSLLAILKKPDPPTTRILASLTLTRIFMLTWDHSNLVREITTPSLPAFITSSLSNIQQKRWSSDELQTVLEVFATLIPRHPTIFRTNEAQIRTVLLTILSSTGSNDASEIHYTSSHQIVGQRLLVLLHHCAAKQGNAQKWEEGLNATVKAAHATCDVLPRAVIESSDHSYHVGSAVHHPSTNENSEKVPQDPLPLTDWDGVSAGTLRIVNLLDLLQSHVETPTSVAVSFRLGHILGLANRLLSISIPTPDTQHSSKINPEIPKDEREAMFSLLPAFHIATLRLIKALFDRFGSVILSTMHSLLELIVNVFQAERSFDDVRSATYHTLGSILRVGGSSISKDDVADLTIIMQACCDDILDEDSSSKLRMDKSSHAAQSSHAKPSRDPHQSHSPSPESQESPRASAKDLLPLLFSQINPQHISRKTRVYIERVAVLTTHKEALLACVMNPAKKSDQATLHPSLMPILARLYPNSPEVEALLRPRMPVIVSKGLTIPEDDIEAFATHDSREVDFAKNERLQDGVDFGSEDADNGPMLVQYTASRFAEEHETLYSATPDPALDANGTEQSNEEATGVEKRRASDSPADEVEAKRLKASPVAETLLPDATSALPGPDPLMTAENFPVTVSTGPLETDATKEVTATLPMGPDANANSHGPKEPHMFEDLPEEVDSDASDFIPAINPDPDTESSDGEDEDEDGGGY